MEAKINMSLKMSPQMKQSLQHLAQAQNRSVHYVMLDLLQQGLERAQQEADYQVYMQQRVLAAYDRLEREGSNGVPAEQVHDRIMANIQKRLAHG